MTNAEILRKAADHIKKHGWRKGTEGWYWNTGGKVCLEGSLLAGCGVLGEGRGLSQKYQSIKAVVARRLGIEPWFVWAWNDLHGSKKSVIALLDDLAFDEDLKAAAIPVVNPAEQELEHNNQIAESSSNQHYRQSLAPAESGKPTATNRQLETPSKSAQKLGNLNTEISPTPVKEAVGATNG